MSLWEVRNQFLKLSGRADLVNPDGSDNGANLLINAASRSLDRLQDVPATTSRHIVTLPAGAMQIEIPDLRAVLEVWIANSEGNSYELVRKDLRYLRETYAAVTTRASGVLTVTGAASNGETVEVDSTTFTFSSSINSNSGTSVAIGSTIAVSLSNLVSAINNELNSVVAEVLTAGETMQVWSKHPGSGGGTITFSTTMANGSCNGSGYLGGTTSGSGYEVGEPTYYSINVIGLAPGQRTLKRSDFAGQHDYQDIVFGNYYNYNGILIAPPTDGTYTISVWAKFYQPTLTADSDENYWSLVHQNILVMAALAQLEAGYRNFEGLRDLMTTIKSELDGIDKDLAELEYGDVTEIEG